jgi:hypothetical protein
MCRLLLNRVGEVFDNRVREKPLTHLPKLNFHLVSSLLTFRKHYSKQLTDPNIFHSPETEGVKGVLDGGSLRIKDGRLQLNSDSGFHAGG